MWVRSVHRSAPYTAKCGILRSTMWSVSSGGPQVENLGKLALRSLSCPVPLEPSARAGADAVPDWKQAARRPPGRRWEVLPGTPRHQRGSGEAPQIDGGSKKA